MGIVGLIKFFFSPYIWAYKVASGIFSIVWHILFRSTALKNKKDAEFDPNSINGKLYQMVVNVRSKMGEPNPDLNLPILDPYRSAKETYKMSNFLMDIKGEVDNLRTEGLSKFIVNDLSFSLAGFPFMFNVTVPYLLSTGSNKNIGNVLYFIPVKGFGPFTVQCVIVDVVIHGKLNYDDDTMIEPDLVIDMDMAKLNLSLIGLSNHATFTTLVNKVVSIFAAPVFNLMWPKYRDQFTNNMKKQILSHMKNLTSQDIIDAFIPPPTTGGTGNGSNGTGEGNTGTESGSNTGNGTNPGTGGNGTESSNPGGETK